MIERGRLAEILQSSGQQVLEDLPVLLPGLSDSEVFDLFDLMEDIRYFEGRLPLRLQIYAEIAQTAPRKELRLLALLRLLRRLGSRKDAPDLGGIPSAPNDFASYMAGKALELCDDEIFATAVASLAMATMAYRSGDLVGMHKATEEGLKALETIPDWTNPPANPTPWDLALAETGHELTFIASNAAYRGGDLTTARAIADRWSESIQKWEESLGPLPRLRYQYFRLAGRLNFEVGNLDAAMESYTKALDYAETPYRKAFIWLAEAQIERARGNMQASWDYAVVAIDAILDSPYPHSAGTWIEWLAGDADSNMKKAAITGMRKRLEASGGKDINRVTRAMTDLYRMISDLHTTEDPSGILPVIDRITSELESAGSWPNLVTLLSAKAVLAGRLGDRELMNGNITRAREILNLKMTPEARPPAEFFLENAHALALRNVGEYDEAFRTLFERALEARKKYAGGVGPEEMVALEAVWYLGALAGYDPETIEQKIRDTISNIS